MCAKMLLPLSAGLPPGSLFSTTLTDEDLKDIGVLPRHRQKMLRAIGKLGRRRRNAGRRGQALAKALREVPNVANSPRYSATSWARW